MLALHLPQRLQKEQHLSVRFLQGKRRAEELGQEVALLRDAHLACNCQGSIHIK